MKVTVNESEQKEITYPCLRERQNGALIVLFTSDSEGTVVKPDSSHFLGEYYDNWSARKFQPFHGTITLEND